VLKGLQEYGQELASQEYQNVFNRLSTIAGYGSTLQQSATNSTTQTGVGANGALAGIGNQGLASAFGIIGSGNAWANAGNQIGLGLGSAFGSMPS
jgi:hypothetical protein